MTRNHQVTERAVYTPAEVCELLGLARGTVYKRLKDGSIPSQKFGRRILISREAIRRLLDPPNNEKVELARDP